MLNTLFTSLCVIVPGIFEQDLKAEVSCSFPKAVIHDVPSFYPPPVYKAILNPETST